MRRKMHQDPDVILWDEIREPVLRRSARINAALEEHNALPTFHTEESMGGSPRLMKVDIETFIPYCKVVSVLTQKLGAFRT